MDAIGLFETLENETSNQIAFFDSFFGIKDLLTEIIAMSNSRGGVIIIGVDSFTGNICGIENELIKKIGINLRENAYSLLDNPHVLTEVVSLSVYDETKKVLVIHVSEGINKPYKDNRASIWIKQGSDKRKLTDNNEILRLFQAGNNLMADEMPVNQASIEDINEEKFRAYFEKLRDRTIEQEGLSYEKALHVKRVMLKGKISLGGLLFFGLNPQYFKTSFCIKAVSFFGNSIGGSEYRDSIDIEGTIPEMFELGMKFFERNLKHVQAGQSFNSIGKLEISPIALEELLQNALLHRDYFKNAPIRLMIFDDRIEIVSPGKLPNGLTVEELKYSNPVPRNNVLISYAKDAMLFRGYGSGISRAYAEQPNIELINDIEGEQFKVIIPREES